MNFGKRAWTPVRGAALGRVPRSRWQLVHLRLPPTYWGSESGVCSMSARPRLMEVPSGPSGMTVSTAAFAAVAGARAADGWEVPESRQAAARSAMRSREWRMWGEWFVRTGAGASTLQNLILVQSVSGTDLSLSTDGPPRPPTCKQTPRPAPTAVTCDSPPVFSRARCWARVSRPPRATCRRLRDS